MHLRKMAAGQEAIKKLQLFIHTNEHDNALPNQTNTNLRFAGAKETADVGRSALILSSAWR